VGEGVRQAKGGLVFIHIAQRDTYQFVVVNSVEVGEITTQNKERERVGERVNR